MNLNWDTRTVLETTESTQNEAAVLLKNGSNVSVIIAKNQTAGRGRRGTTWISEPDASLTMSLIFHQYPNHPKPWLIGMAVSLAAASTLHSQLRWPNDLTIKGKKVGGVLTELIQNSDGKKIPVVGVGININQEVFSSELANIATSLFLERSHKSSVVEIAEEIVRNLDDLPEPTDWSLLEPAWRLFDDTPGKLYQLATGERANSIGIGPNGDLICSVAGETQQVMAAEAIFE